MRLWDCLSLLEIMSVRGLNVSAEDGKRLKEARKVYQNEENIYFLFYMYAVIRFQRGLMESESGDSQTFRILLCNGYLYDLINGHQGKETYNYGEPIYGQG